MQQLVSSESPSLADIEIKNGFHLQFACFYKFLTYVRLSLANPSFCRLPFLNSKHLFLIYSLNSLIRNFIFLKDRKMQLKYPQFLKTCRQLSICKSLVKDGRKGFLILSISYILIHQGRPSRKKMCRFYYDFQSFHDTILQRKKVRKVEIQNSGNTKGFQHVILFASMPLNSD